MCEIHVFNISHTVYSEVTIVVTVNKWLLYRQYLGGRDGGRCYILDCTMDL